MIITSKINVKGYGNDLERLFVAEQKGSKNNRAGYTTEKEGDNFIIRITAKDSTAFRAVTNSVSKLLTAYEKTRDMIKDEK